MEHTLAPGFICVAPTLVTKGHTPKSTLGTVETLYDMSYIPGNEGLKISPLAA